MEMKSDKSKIGKYSIKNSRLVKIKEAPSKSEVEKSSLIKEIGEGCVPKKFVTVLKRELKEEGSQTEDITKSKRKCIEKIPPGEIKIVNPTPTPSLDEVIGTLCQSTPEFSNLGRMLTQEAANTIGGCTRLILRTIIENAKKTACQENRKRITPSDVDLAISAAQIDNDLTCPVLKPTPSTDRMYWGRKSVKRKNIIDATSQDIVSNERFCDSIMIKDHWLVVEGIQPCVPENVIPSEVKQKFQEQQEETQRVYGYGVPGLQRLPMPDKRTSTQMYSVEHQVLYAEVTRTLTSGSALERQKVLEVLESDTGIQFLAGRFVILIAEGVRLHIGTRNIRGLANLLKLTWSLMKNPHIRLEKYLYVLVPSLISCVVSKSLVPLVDSSRIASKSTSTTKSTAPVVGTPELTEEDRERIIRDMEFEFKVRESSGKLLAELSQQYENQNLSVRIIQTLRKVLTGSSRDPAAVYGVLCTFFAFGNLTITTVVLPKLHDIFCSLKASQSNLPTVKTTMTRLRKLIVETEVERMEVVQNRTIELIMKIIFENEIFNERKLADHDAYVTLYAEFGALFYTYALSTGMIHETTGHLKVNRPSLLLKPQAFRVELEKFLRKSQRRPQHLQNNHHQNNNRGSLIADESMLDNLLDDSVRPWTKAASQVEEAEQSPLNIQDKETFFRKPKLFLVRKEKSEGKLVASFIRPLEYGYMPSLPSSRHSRKSTESSSAPRDTVARESILGQSIYASRASECMKNPEETDEILKRFVERPDDQSGAIIYGRNMMMTENRIRGKLDEEIAKATMRMSQVRLRNSVAFSRSAGKKDEMSKGRFLTRPQTLH
ncbi:hypothetical protein CAEBREN_01937 [Caenorhabditis brenneri]|uniref:TAF6 C-terminal HEAT repeat domain-containing protein n=1 Tax=Caenorhabditis brenneri TaxID=135651 RepID=G0NRY2_CAEBE|nr:hypothetical protein CAEBREN_01937 [Caenorhabditis brenneri]